ncbi:MAG: Ig-like domain-containing protein [Polaromonas sp.]
MNFLKYLSASALLIALAACGGGGGSAGTASGTAGANTGASGSTSTTSVTPAAVSDFVLLLDKNSINNSGTDKAQLTVTAVDANRNIVSGAQVAVVVDKNGIFTPAVGSVTDATGSYTGNLKIGGDKSDRVITLTVTVNGIVKRTSVSVIGSRLVIQAAPSTASPGQSVSVTTTLLDSASAPIPSTAITISGDVTGLPTTSRTTDLNGVVTFTVTAPTTPGSYKISVSGNGINAPDYQLIVFSTVIPVASIPAGVTPSLSASPNVLVTNSPGSTASNSTLRFLFLDSATASVKNVRVRFKDLTTGLALVGASISNTSTLYTDASGVVSVQYNAGQNSSPTNGVTVRACYSASDFISADDCPSNVDVNLTTSGQAIAVSIGDDNLLTKGAGTYIKKFAVTVADSAGKAVVNAPVAISVDLTHYGKGQSDYVYKDKSGVKTDALTVVPFSLLNAYPADISIDPVTSPQRIWCANEDTNRNGIVDPGENINGSVDSNGQPTINPRKSDLIVSYDDPAVTKTNSSGVLVIKVEYSQRFGTWLAYNVIASTSVSGSQGMAERLFVTDILDVDVKNGSFLTPPYGVGACNSPN